MKNKQNKKTMPFNFILLIKAYNNIGNSFIECKNYDYEKQKKADAFNLPVKF